MRNTVGAHVRTEIASIATMATFQQAIQTLQHRELRTLYVVDQDHRLVGLLPDYLLVKALLHNSGDQPEISRLMCTTPTVLLSETLMSVAAPLFREARFDALPVTHDGRLLGELRRSDAIAWLLESQTDEAESIVERPEPTTPPLKGPTFLKRSILASKRIETSHGNPTE